MDRTKIAAVAVLACGVIVLIGSLFALYSVNVTPSAVTTRGNDSPSGSVDVGIGFYDIVPFAPPIVAEAIPVLMVLAALTAAPLLVRAAAQTVDHTRRSWQVPLTLLALALALSGPLPSVDVNGQMAAKLSEETGGQSINSMIDAVVSVSPGAGLVIAIIFSLIGWVAAVSLIFQRNSPAGPGPGPFAPRRDRRRAECHTTGNSVVMGYPHPHPHPAAVLPQRWLPAGIGAVALAGLLEHVAADVVDGPAGATRKVSLCVRPGIGGISKVRERYSNHIGFYDWIASGRPVVAVAPLAPCACDRHCGGSGVGGAGTGPWGVTAAAAICALIMLGATAIRPQSPRDHRSVADTDVAPGHGDDPEFGP